MKSSTISVTETRRRRRPAIALVFLAPFVGEYLLGNITIKDFLGLPFLGLLYGTGAIIIREVARRAGRGWPTILCLGVAYGVIEAALIDHSLFNQSFEDLDFTAGYISSLGFSPYYALAFVIGHAVWSIGVPIALVEGFTREPRREPWLGNVGLTVTAVLYALGSLLIETEVAKSESFRPTVGQFLAAGAAAALAVVVALRIGRRPVSRAVKPAPSPRKAGVIAFIISSTFFMAPENWFGVVYKVAVVAGAVALLRAWSRRAGWSESHRVAVAGGAMLTYAWAAFAVSSLKGYTEPIVLIGNVIFALVSVLLFLAAGRAARLALE